MGHGVVSKRYAKALVDITGPKMGSLEGAKQTFTIVKELFDIKEAKDIIQSPIVSVATKKRLIDIALDRVGCEDYIRHFFYVVIEAKRASFIPSIIDSYIELILAANNQSSVCIESAAKLDAQQIQGIKSEMERVLSKKLFIEKVEEKSELLGGFVVSVGHKKIDLSLKNKLELLSTQVAQ